MIMYGDQQLVQTVLDVLMRHHQAHRALLENVKQVQLLSNQKSESQYKRITRLLGEVLTLTLTL